MLFVVELAVNQPSRRNVGGDDSPISQRCLGLWFLRLNFVAIPTTSGRFITELIVSMLLDDLLGFRHVIENSLRLIL